MWQRPSRADMSSLRTGAEQWLRSSSSNIECSARATFA
eukprot:CAMPEP_0172698118 /NCGR_PEP_ID=MMETSP1074-20121228/29236_1 /TAXON_ID=2916 /ORGANISM="Ceratium fusus, Strain PA161109" /LENGTH=37 /DNA_ID= /DNA_START= /DNA_END= /DNA_ORIENTATION=